MKNLVILLSVVFAISAQAELKVGDSALYAFQMPGQSFDLSQEVQSVDPANDSFFFKQSVMMNGSVVQQTIEQQEISENDQNEAIFELCLQLPAELKPRYESVSVPAGTFNTCHITVSGDDGSVIDGFFAKVLFGTVKMTQKNSDGSLVSVELKSFKKN